MIFRKFEEVSAFDIKSLIEAGKPEGVQIEYKRELPSGSNDDKKEFLADISSFANTKGGDLIFGLDELRDENGRSTGIPQAIAPIVENADAAIQRLDSMARDGLAPRLSGFRLRAVPVEGGVVVLARIERSLAGPHQVTFQGSGRFYSRNSAGKYQMDVGEIGRAFRGLAELPRTLRQLHQSRIDVILSDAPAPLLPGGKIIVHFVPISSFVDGVSLGREDVRRQSSVAAAAVGTT